MNRTKIKQVKSDITPAYNEPYNPKIFDNIIARDINKIICLVKDTNVDFLIFPSDCIIMLKYINKAYH